MLLFVKTDTNFFYQKYLFFKAENETYHKGSDKCCKRGLTYFLPKGLILCPKKKILGVESRDLSQTDTILKIVSSSSKLREDSRTSFSVSQQLRPKISVK